jgi:multidrug resistance protein MdtO
VACQNVLQWLPEFFRQELKPYPGRGAVVARMVIAATLSMIIIVTFRIPYGAIGVNCAFILSRENLVATAKSGFYFILAFALWALLTPIGARMFASVPATHFFWELFSIFLCFFLLRTLTNFPLTAGIVVVATGTLVIWYLPGPAESNVELTLWQILATSIGAAITVLVEVVFHYYDKTDPLREGLLDRLRNIDEMLRACSEGLPVQGKVSQALTRYAVTGTGTLRQQVARYNRAPLQRMKLSALVSLTGRCIDFAAAYVSGFTSSGASDRERAVDLLFRVVQVRTAVESGNPPGEWPALQPHTDDSPLFTGLVSMVNLMASVLRTGSPADPCLTILEQPESPPRLLVEDAFTNPDHLKFALVGTTAAMLCYIIYVALDWPGISTAVTTCLLTALSNIGSSRQKQILRIGGAAFGGFVFGLGSQMFVLPYIDSITGLTVLFACVTAISAYVATSSTRLSYAGLQMAFAFYLINVTDFTISLDLTIGRDRAIGVLLGITMMWIVFERLRPRSAADQMVLSFAQTARLIAALLAKEPGADGKEGIVLMRHQRDQLSRRFDDTHAEADAVLFETGPRRAAHLAARDRVQRWQATLRTFYVMELPFLLIQVSGGPNQSSPAFRDIDTRFRRHCSDALIQIADRLEGELRNASLPLLPENNQSASATNPEGRGLTPPEERMLGFINQLSNMVEGLQSEVFRTSVFAH